MASSNSISQYTDSGIAALRRAGMPPPIFRNLFLDDDVMRNWFDVAGQMHALTNPLNTVRSGDVIDNGNLVRASWGVLICGWGLVGAWPTMGGSGKWFFVAAILAYAIAEGAVIVRGVRDRSRRASATSDMRERDGTAIANSANSNIANNALIGGGLGRPASTTTADATPPSQSVRDNILTSLGRPTVSSGLEGNLSRVNLSVPSPGDIVDGGGRPFDSAGASSVAVNAGAVVGGDMALAPRSNMII